MPSLLTKLGLGLAGAVLLAAAIAASMSVRRFEAGATRTNGTVVALRAGGSHPTVEFTASDGLIRRFYPNGLIFGYQPGDQVQVLYDAADPQRTAALDAVGSLWAWPLVLGVIGSGFLLAVYTSN